MAINWTPSTAGGSGFTGTPEYKVDDDGTVHWRGLLTLTSGAAFTAYFFLPAVTAPLAGVHVLYVDYEPGGRGLIINATECYLNIQGAFTAGQVINLDPLSYQGTPLVASGGASTVIDGGITRDGQYLFNGILFNNSLSDLDSLKVISCEGLFDLPSFKGHTSEHDDDHGGQVHRHLLSMRRIVMEVAYLSSSKAGMYLITEEITERLQPVEITLPLSFRRPGVGTRFVNAKVSKFSGFRNEWNKEMGLSTAVIEFVCPDPRKFAYTERSVSITIPASQTLKQEICNNQGNFLGGAKPVFEITGPATNPRIGNNEDALRSMKLDMVIPAGQTLFINAHDRTITLGGVDHSDKVRTDNQWWVLVRGNNTVTFQRADSPANTATMVVKWWDSYA